MNRVHIKSMTAFYVCTVAPHQQIDKFTAELF